MNRRRQNGARHGSRGLCALLALVIFLLVGPVQAEEPADFGAAACLVVKFVQGQPERDLPMLDDLGVRWVRELVSWSEFEPQPGNHVGLSRALKRQLAYYRRHDIGFVALLGLDNPIAYPPGLDGSIRAHDPVAFGQFALAVAQALEREGVRFVLEIGNEPHNSALFHRLGGAWNGSPPSPWLNHYVAMANAAVTAVKDWRPEIRMLAQDDMWLLHYRFIDAGLSPRIDGFSVHPYVVGIPERAAVAHDTDWARPYQLVDKDRAFISAVERLREYARVRMGRTPEIWITEWGWPAGARSPAFTAEQVADYLPRAFLLAAEAGVKETCWFSSQDNVDGPMGLTFNSGARRPAYQAFRVMTRELSGLHFERRLPVFPGRVRGIHALRFAGNSAGARIVTWTAELDQASLRLIGDGSALLGDGNPAPVRVQADGARCVALGSTVIYLAGDWSDPANLRAFAGNDECRGG